MALIRLVDKLAPGDGKQQLILLLLRPAAADEVRELT